MAGFECTDQLNAFGNRVDFLHLTGHLALLEADYRRLGPFGIRSVREGIRWSQVETAPHRYDWSTVRSMIRTGRALGIQQIWDLCHFGYPSDLTPLHPHFAGRFAALCRAFVEFYREEDPDGPLIITPFNEVSFIAWLGGDVRGTAPYCVGLGWEVKYALMRAYIQGAQALLEADPRIRLLTTEPLANTVPALDATEAERERAQIVNEYQFQTTDILCGRMCPELGGRPEYLDLIGLNYYYNNQWVIDTHSFLPWVNDDNDPRWRPLRDLIKGVNERYQRPIILSETSHPKEDRPLWIQMIAEESLAVLKAGIPLRGVCLYPIIDRPDWDHLTPWHHAGLWDAEPGNEGLSRVLYEPYARALLAAQDYLSKGLQLAQTGVPLVPAQPTVPV